MKKISILIISLMYCLKAMSQDTPVNDLVNINLPNGAEKISIARHCPNTAIGNGEISEFERGTGKGDFYKGNGILINLIGAHGNAPEDFLEKRKKWLQDLFQTDGYSLPPHYASNIKTINNYQVLIITYARQNFSYYTFYAVNNTRTSILSGEIEFQETDRDKVAGILDDMLKSLTFK